MLTLKTLTQIQNLTVTEAGYRLPAMVRGDAQVIGALMNTHAYRNEMDAMEDPAVFSSFLDQYVDAVKELFLARADYSPGMSCALVCTTTDAAKRLAQHLQAAFPELTTALMLEASDNLDGCDLIVTHRFQINRIESNTLVTIITTSPGSDDFYNVDMADRLVPRAPLFPGAPQDLIYLRNLSDQHLDYFSDVLSELDDALPVFGRGARR